MRFGRYKIDGEEKFGLFSGEIVLDLSNEYDSFIDALKQPDPVNKSGLTRCRIEEISFLPPITDSSAIFCTALNYKAHAGEATKTVPDHPLIFLKLPRSLIGHKQPIHYHTKITSQLDYEAELAVVIGGKTRNVTPEEALDYIAGYTIMNDISARDLQYSLQTEDNEVRDWFSGKAMEKTTPLGPYVIVNEIQNPQNLNVVSRLNGEVMQDDNSSNMIRGVSELISFISTRVSLHPGDIIATGTPEGVGAFQNIKLEKGDTIEVEIEEIGVLKNTVRDPNTM